MYFKDIIGLNDVKKHLIESVQMGFVPHARLIYGPEGVGKLPLAIAYARYLNCQNQQPNDACGKCPSCHKFDKLSHPDLHFVFPTIKSKACDEYLSDWRLFLSQNTYFDVNDWLNFINAGNAQCVIYGKESDQILRKLSMKVYEALYKVMIIWLPEKMNDTSANKLLKILEEPFDNTVFLLVSEDIEKVLLTIQSRCQPLHIRAIEEEEMMVSIQNLYGVDSDSAASVAHVANGSFTKAINLIQSSDENNSLLELFKEMMRASVSREIKKVKKIAFEIAGIGREKQKNFLQYCLRMFREYFVSNLNEPKMVYLNAEEAQFGERFAPFINEKNIEQLFDEFALAQRQIEQNGNAKIIFLDLCMKVTVLLIK